VRIALSYAVWKLKVVLSIRDTLYGDGAITDKLWGEDKLEMRPVWMGESLTGLSASAMRGRNRSDFGFALAGVTSGETFLQSLHHVNYPGAMGRLRCGYHGAALQFGFD
jgi:hypothetical protein